MDIEAIIATAKEAAERDLQKKKELSGQCKVEVNDVMRPEELDHILSDNFFGGKVGNLSALQRYEKMKLAASWLDCHCFECVGIDIQPPSRSRTRVTISIEIRRLSYLKDKPLRVFTALNILADSVFISGVKDDVVRYEFGVEGVSKQ